MFLLGILIASYSYAIFLIGVFGYLTKNAVFLITLIWVFLVIKLLKNKFVTQLKKISIKEISQDKFELVTVSIIIILLLINFIGIFIPEISFDALWYHLTIPKLYIDIGKITFIPGGLLYYSALPKMGEILYISALFIDGTTLTKFIHFFFSLLCLISLYGFSRIFVSKKFALLSVLIFYSNLVVLWESTASYIDLIWTFFEIISFWSFFRYISSKNKKDLILSALFLGFAAGTKLLGIRDIVLIIVFITILGFVEKKNFLTIFKDIILYSTTFMIVLSPWIIFSYFYTNNPIYPFLTNIYSLSTTDLFNFLNILREYTILFIKSPDPISPIYIIVLPLIFIYFTSLNLKSKYLSIFVLLSLILWYLTYQVGAEGRYMIPYLALYSTLCSILILKSNTYIRKTLLIIVFIIAFSSILYRGIATLRFLPVVFGQESKGDFLTKNLNFDFGDFYDTDGWFAENIRENDKVLLIGFHNLYYVDFPFVHESYLKPEDSFNYIAAQNTDLPKRYNNWKLVYENDTTNVKVYKDIN